MSQPTQSLDEDPRRKMLLEAAAELFFRDGYAATSIDAIIARAGGSKRTIYALFGNKQGLFEALLHENARGMFDSLAPEADETTDLATALTSFAERLLTLLAQPRAIAAFRVAVSELPHLPSLAQSFNDLGPARGLQWLSIILARARDRGDIAIEDPSEAASQFLGLVRGNHYFDLMLGLREPPSAEAARKLAQSATKVFLLGVTKR